VLALARWQPLQFVNIAHSPCGAVLQLYIIRAPSQGGKKNNTNNSVGFLSSSCNAIIRINLIEKTNLSVETHYCSYNENLVYGRANIFGIKTTISDMYVKYT
jgi:hypothetical protein